MRPTRVRLSVPGPGRSVAASAERWGAPLRRAVTMLEQGGMAAGDAWAAVCQWLLGRSCGVLTAEADLKGAACWFYGEGSHTRSADPGAEAAALSFLRSLMVGDQFRDLLPYILDHHGPGSRRSVMRDESTNGVRSARRTRGIYYTPADVAEHMVSRALEGFAPAETPLMLDPACGTGVFLLAALRLLTTQTGKPASLIIPSLYGIDIDPLAIDLCAFVLTHECLSDLHGVPPASVWHAVRRNLAVADVLSLPSTGALFPDCAAGFGVVIANPPYAVLGARSDLPELSRRFESLQGGAATAASSMYIPFIEMMWRFARADRSRAAMVIPLSIAYSGRKDHVNLRRRMMQVPGRWQFSFYDRTPDSLFGDDVKQRCAIVLRTATGSGETQIETGALQRWTSRTRHRLFDSPDYTPLPATAIDAWIPKLGSAEEASAYCAVRRSCHQVRSVLTGSSQSDKPAVAERTVFAAGTAYNWLTVYRDLRSLESLGAQPTGSPLKAIAAGSPEDADALLAILCSRVTYWLWRVEGDGFHVPLGFIKRLPWNQRLLGESRWAALAAAGRRLWDGMKAYPVFATNAGKRTVTFCPYGCRDELDQIDTMLLSGLGVDPGFSRQLEHLILAAIVVDPQDQARVRRGLSWRYGSEGSL